MAFAYPAYKLPFRRSTNSRWCARRPGAPGSLLNRHAFAISGGTVNVRPAFAVIFNKCDRKPAAVPRREYARAAGVVQFRKRIERLTAGYGAELRQRQRQKRFILLRRAVMAPPYRQNWTKAHDSRYPAPFSRAG